MQAPFNWPVLTRYGQDYLGEIALPLGGIGTGTVSLGGRGNLRDWELTGVPRKGYRPHDSFFLIRAAGAGAEPITRVLEAELQPPFEHSRGFDEPHYGVSGLPRFRFASFEAAYPLGQVLLSSPEVPVRVRLQAFNPMVPTDPEASGIPAAVLRFVVENLTGEALDVDILGTLGNYIGEELSEVAEPGNRNRFREGGTESSAVRGIFLDAPGLPEHSPAAGSMALALLSSGATVQHCESWRKGRWPIPVERLWRRFDTHGELADGAYDEPHPAAALCAGKAVPPSGTVDITFLLAWHFPNREAWQVGAARECCGGEDKRRDPAFRNVGNHYATVWRDAWDVAEKVAPRLPELEQRTVRFVKSFVASDLPDVLKEAALYNVSTLRSTTCFRTRDGSFFGWEGSRPDGGCCPGSCTHVWGYETATHFLFGSLARSMREVHYRHGVDADGRMRFRLGLPLECGMDYPWAAADGQMSALLKLHRDWTLCGDTEWLRSLWPHARKTVEFCWLDNGWDADQDGVMEGVQHNTSDLELFGPNPLVTGWYLAGLRAAADMARAVGDTDFAQRCEELSRSGGAWVDENLYNGEYYIQQVRRPPAREAVPEGTWMALEVGPDEPVPQQIETGCQTDQLVGPLWAKLCGLGEVLDRGHVRTALQAILKRNFKTIREQPSFFRAFALNDERALLLGTYPEGAVPAQPLFRFSEVWNGCEYVVAAHLIYEGFRDEGLEVVTAIRERYDGRKRNPFNEPECGNHYVRSMAAFSAYLAWTGFDYDARANRMTFQAPASGGRYFWSTGAAWGDAVFTVGATGTEVRLSVHGGELTIQELQLLGGGSWRQNAASAVSEGETITCTVS
jgi:uncharacterized protein (DUF608 family)